ncbi:hypothetical protein QQX98_003370 [Neonectria punicea]|uniref:Uncharacterized protein n=1 Tax=Neonectria punicea TaxID=979145 RepID=A0ABR1HF75_9HYPO
MSSSGPKKLVFGPERPPPPHVRVALHCGICSKAFTIYRDRICISKPSTRVPVSDSFVSQNRSNIPVLSQFHPGLAEKNDHIDHDPPMRRLGCMPDHVPDGQDSFYGIPGDVLSYFSDPFPRQRYNELSRNLARTDDLVICSMKSCPIYRSEPETFTVHYHCFESLYWLDDSPYLFSRLWQVLVWQTPWRDAQPNFLPNRRKMTLHGFVVAAKRVNIPHLYKLPLEVAQMVREYCEDAPFWNLVRSADLCVDVTYMATTELETVPLELVLEWTRGGLFKLVENLVAPHFVRITLDNLGIREIKRLDLEPAPFTLKPVENWSFIFIDQSSCENVSLLLKNGLARLQLPDGHPGFPVWDTPSPPHVRTITSTVLASKIIHTSKFSRESHKTPPTPVEQSRVIFRNCGICGVDTVPATRFHAIDFKSVTGFTFLYTDPEGLLTIHAHTPESPDVKVPKGVTPDNLIYAYLPIPPGEEILQIITQVGPLTWARTSPPHFTFRLKLAGLVTVGTKYNRKFDRMVVFHPTGLVFNRTELGHVNFLAAYSVTPPKEEHPHSNRATCEPGMKPDLPPEGPQAIPGPVPFFSCAPLHNVVRVRAFCESADESALRGIMLDYANGAQRLLGQYRPGWVPQLTYENPTRICLRRPSTNSILMNGIAYESAVQIECGHSMRHRHMRGIWECHEMDEVLQFYYSNNDEQGSRFRPVRDREAWPAEP